MISPITENIPEELTGRPQWVCWRLELRDDKLTKVLYTPEDRRRADTTAPATWDAFEGAASAYEASGGFYDGIGFVFSKDDPFVGIDLDDCRNPETGEIAEWAQSILGRVVDSYTEVSPSGTGVHVIVEGTLRSNRRRKKVHIDGEVVGLVEMYDRARFFTITGRAL